MYQDRQDLLAFRVSPALLPRTYRSLNHRVDDLEVRVVPFVELRVAAEAEPLPLAVIQDNLESSRKENEKRMKDLEKRGAKFRKELTKRFKKLEKSDVVEDTKAQFEKVQDQVEDAVESVKEKLTSKAA